MTARRLATICALAALVLVPASSALGGAVAKSGDLTLQIKAGVTPNKASSKGKPRSVGISFEQKLGTVSGQRSQGFIKTITITLPAGMRINTSAIPACVETQLQVQQDAACPVGSRLGSGTAMADARPTLPTPVQATIVAFNGIDDSNPDGTPSGKRLPALLLHASALGMDAHYPFDISGRRLVLTQAAPTAPGPGLFTITQVDVTLAARVGAHHKAWAVAPRTCKHKWVFTETIAFFDGTSITASDAVPCRKA